MEEWFCFKYGSTNFASTKFWPMPNFASARRCVYQIVRLIVRLPNCSSAKLFVCQLFRVQNVSSATIFVSNIFRLPDFCRKHSSNFLPRGFCNEIQPTRNDGHENVETIQHGIQPHERKSVKECWWSGRRNLIRDGSNGTISITMQQNSSDPHSQNPKACDTHSCPIVTVLFQPVDPQQIALGRMFGIAKLKYLRQNWFFRTKF